MSPIFENIASIRNRIREAALRGGRDPEAVQLAAVTKYAGDAQIREALETGALRWIAESRVQDAARKRELFRDLLESKGTGMRMIGHLQSNKAGKAVETFDAIDSLDSLKTAQALDRRLQDAGKTLPVLVQLNLGNPGQRGIVPDELGAFLDSLKPFASLRVRGLMAIGAHTDDADQVRAGFKEARGLFERFFDDASESVLSLGMSSDFELAVEEGATLVRVGSAIFEPSEQLSSTREEA